VVVGAVRGALAALSALLLGLPPLGAITAAAVVFVVVVAAMSISNRAVRPDRRPVLDAQIPFAAVVSAQVAISSVT
jgi:hypothetical protein